MPIIDIDDINAPELEAYARLTEARQNTDIFIAESHIVIEKALDAGCTPISLLMRRRHIATRGADIIARCGDIPAYTAADETLKKLTGYALTRGILCAMRRPAQRNAIALCGEARRLVVMEGVTDTTNVGAIFRSAAALGADAILLTPDCGDPLSRRAARVSIGAVFQIPWARFGKSRESDIAMLRDAGYVAVAMALDDGAIDISELRINDKTAVILGAEGDGLARATIDKCDYVAKIPMRRGVDSLNVGSAGAVAFWTLFK